MEENASVSGQEGNRESSNESYKGHLSPYVEGESFEDYLVLANNYFELNANKPNSEKVRMLISYIGLKGIKVINALKGDYAEKSFAEVFTMSRKLFIAVKNIREERYNFNTRLQHEYENIQDFSKVLERMAEQCDFDINFLDQALSDRFIAGIQDENIRNQLLALEPSKTFKEVVDIASRIPIIEHDSLPTSKVISPKSAIKMKPKSYAFRSRPTRILCYCNKAAFERTVFDDSKDSANKKQKIYKCANDVCKFLEWVDDLPAKQKRKCGICHLKGHNRLNCPRANHYR